MFSDKLQEVEVGNSQPYCIRIVASVHTLCIEDNV